MVAEAQEKSIKHTDYCYSFYFSNIFRPFSVSIYFCFGCFGLSGYFMETILLPMLVLSIYTRNSPCPSTLKKS